MRLNALTRLCIVLYVLGVTISPVFVWFQVATTSNKYATDMYESCLSIQDASPDFRAQCIKDYSAHQTPEFWLIYWDGFKAALLVGAILWLICFAATRTIRWILAGREK